MQLVLELLKKIFVALQGVYTKQETDAALAEIDLQRVIGAQSSRNVVMNNILTIAKTPVDNVHPLLLMGDFSSRIGSVNTTTGQISGFVNETMPQGDGTFVVTNRVSGGPLELSEDGTAPNHAVSLCQLTAEAQAREQADAKHDAEIDWLKTAVDGDWKTYMLGRAAMTGIQKNIDLVNRAIKESNTNSSAVLPARLIEDWKILYVGYEAWLFSVGYKSPLNGAFWISFFDAVEKFEAAPSETGELVYDVAPARPIVDLTAISLTVPKTTNVDIYCPNVTAVIGLSYNSAFNSVFIFPKLNNRQYSFYGLRKYNQPTWLFGIKTQRSTLEFCEQYNSPVFAENIINADALVNNCTKFDYPLFIPKCTSANEIFRLTAVSAGNIAKTLDSLPSTTKGKFGLQKCTGAAYVESTETFTVADSDGTEYSVENCPIFTTDDEAQTLRKSYVLAIAKKGWEISLQNA
jgi:hypothetical protein